MRRALLALALASIAIASPARANGRFPQTNQLVIAPSDPSTLLMRTTFGVLLSRDGGKAWDWICETAIGYGGQTEDPAFGITAGGGIIAGTFEGLATSQDSACSWSFVGGDLKGTFVVDTVVRPDSPHVALALTNNGAGTSDGGDPIYVSHVFRSTDDGATWASFGAPIDSRSVLETIEVAASDPHRVYVSGFTDSTGARTALLYVSTDDGATWTARTIPLVANETAPYIGAVDPSNADRVYARTSGMGTSRLLVTDDAGQTWRAVLTATELAGFALSPDGSKVYAGGPTDGLHVASTADFAFTKTADIVVLCLRSSASALFACSKEVSGFSLGSSTDDGKSFTPIFHLASIRGPLSCPSGTQTAACASDWPGLMQRLDYPASDAGADAGANAPAPASKSCGCGVTSREADRASIAAAILALAFAILRPRTRPSRGSR